MKRITFKDIETGGFWKNRIDINTASTLPNIYDRFAETGRFDAFRCDWTEGKDKKPHFFWDSDVAKWIEAAAYSLEYTPDESLEENIDNIVDLIEKNQTQDGYFNIYFTVVEPGKRFTIRDYHELYCAGHLIEAAIAYYNATGKEKFLSLMKKYVDLIEKVFCKEQSAAFDTPGHEEIELALIKLYDLTGEKRYLDICGYFLDMRGRSTKDFAQKNWSSPHYYQADVPLREITTAKGHSVRACYLYCGMADYAARTGDKEMLAACERVFYDIYYKQMYVTGGIGATARGEAFTESYVLPNDLAYSETCASIALALFARRMTEIKPDSKYADCAERAIYNCSLGGVSLDGSSFFYVNPLEINLERHRLNKEYYGRNDNLLTQRVKVFDCSCCPPNIARFVASIGDFLYTFDEGTLYIHHYMQSTAKCGDAKITQETAYPNEGRIKFTFEGMKGKTVAIRLPSWCANPLINSEAPGNVKDGYAYIKIENEIEIIEADFEIIPKLVCANPLVADDAGKVCVCAGPLVYCAESVLNGGIKLGNVSIKSTLNAGKEFDKQANAYALFVDAAADEEMKELYADYSPAGRKAIRLKMLPYFAYANNGESDMIIWLREGV